MDAEYDDDGVIRHSAKEEGTTLKQTTKQEAFFSRGLHAACDKLGSEPESESTKIGEFQTFRHQARADRFPKLGSADK